MQKKLVAFAAIFMIGVSSAQAQPPERFRLDLGFGLTIDPNDKIIAYPGRRAPQVGVAGADSIFALDVNATVNATEDLSIFAGLPLGIVYQVKANDEDDPPIVQASDTDEDIEAGIGDVSVGASYRLVSDGEYWPSVGVGLQVNIPTAFPSSVQGYLGNRLYSLTPFVTLSKSLTERLQLIGNVNYTEFLDEDDIEIESVISVEGGLGIGLSDRWFLNLSAGVADGGKIERDGEERTDSRTSVNLGAGFTYYDQGRPLFSFGLYGLSINEDPVAFLRFTWAVLSI